MSSAEQALLLHVPGTVRIDGVCGRTPAEDATNGATASITCIPSTGASLVRYEQFPDATSMRDAYARILRQNDLQRNVGDCVEGRSEQTWGYGSEGEEGRDVQGRLACWLKRGDAWMAWTFEEFVILSSAHREDRAWQRFVTWWENEAGPR